MMREEFEPLYGSKVEDTFWKTVEMVYHHPYFKDMNKEQFAQAIKSFGTLTMASMAQEGEAALNAYNSIIAANNESYEKVNKIKSDYKKTYGIDL